jgi:hypothetical protein
MSEVAATGPQYQAEGLWSRIVFYARKNEKKNYAHTPTNKPSNRLFGRERLKGNVIAAHEIVNPEAVENPDKLAKAPHIHWELENIMAENYRQD